MGGQGVPWAGVLGQGAGVTSIQHLAGLKGARQCQLPRDQSGGTCEGKGLLGPWPRQILRMGLSGVSIPVQHCIPSPRPAQQGFPGALQDACASPSPWVHSVEEELEPGPWLGAPASCLQPS